MMTPDEARRDYTHRLEPSNTHRCHDCHSYAPDAVWPCVRLGIAIANPRKSRCPLWAGKHDTGADDETR